MTSFRSNLGSQPERSKSGFASKFVTCPRQRYATGTICSGKFNSFLNTSLDTMLTHPKPIFSALAANHKFCMAPQTL